MNRATPASLGLYSNAIHCECLTLCLPRVRRTRQGKFADRTSHAGSLQ